MTTGSIASTIRRIPKGKVSTYGAVARAAGYPRGARLVARALRGAFDLPWQRVLGAGGEIKLRGEHALEQRFRLQAEGVTFRGRRVDMKLHEFKFSNKQKKKNAGHQPLARVSSGDR
jgi:methylated-DNA-protein-cysteine methyltransferase-like protein